jgi:aspartyl-tRNA(Asn)/glutamyl-tRNA(Gln) amidotransferase subunit A
VIPLMSSEFATAVSLRARLSTGEISSEEVVRSLLDRAQRAQRLNAFVHLDPDGALAQARAIDARRAAGEMIGRLGGVPVAIKDVLCVEGEPTTCGSRMLRNFRPPYDATVIAKLRAAGAILFGKTNMDEFAMGSSTENSAYPL